MLEIKNLVLGFHTCAGINIWAEFPTYFLFPPACKHCR